MLRPTLYPTPMREFKCCLRDASTTFSSPGKVVQAILSRSFHVLYLVIHGAHEMNNTLDPATGKES